MTLCRTVALAALCLALSSTSAYAQSRGTFRWQLQPFCNVITVDVTQHGDIYVLDGTDDRCGDSNQPGSAVGIAYLTPLGLVGFGITTVLPGGTPLHTEATLSLSSLGGTWRDSAGNSGAFVFNGALPGATPRPIPSGASPQPRLRTFTLPTTPSRPRTLSMQASRVSTSWTPRGHSSRGEASSSRSHPLPRWSGASTSLPLQQAH